MIEERSGCCVTGNPIIWVVAYVSAIATVGLYFASRPEPPPGVCADCQYNLTGNISGVCPECGTPTGAPT